MSNYLGFIPTNNPEYFFLSYSNSAVNDISEIALVLESNNIPMWYDHGIPYGEKWENSLAIKINNAKAVLFFLTKDIFERDSYVKEEFKMAYKNFNKKVYVIMVDEIHDDEIPVEHVPWWNKLQELQNINIFKYGNATDKALEIIRAIHSNISNTNIKIPPLSKPKSREEEKILTLLTNADDMLEKAKDSERAKSLYENVINLAPTNPFGWFGMAKVATENFTSLSRTNAENAKQFVSKALNLASETDAETIHKQWNKYVNKFNSFQNECRLRISENNKQIVSLTNKNNELSQKLNLFKYGKTNCFTVLWRITKILISVAISFGVLIGYILLSGAIIPILQETDFGNSVFFFIIMAVLPQILSFAIPGITFLFLYKKFVKRNVSKSNQLKINATEKEYIDNQNKIESLKQENIKLNSLL